MINRNIIYSIYEYSYLLSKQGLEGISHQDSLITPPGGSNPANWTLGHIITSRCNVMAMLGLEPPWNLDRCKPYLPDSEPLTPDSKIEDFGDMKLTFKKTQIALLEVISEIIRRRLL